MGAEELIKNFDLNEIDGRPLQERVVSLRMPDEYKMKYGIIQASSDRRFSEHMRNVFITEIDKVWPNLEKKLKTQGLE